MPTPLSRARLLPLFIIVVSLLGACKPPVPGTGKVGQKLDYQGYSISVAAVEFGEDFPGARKARDGYTLAALDVIVASDRAKDVTFRPKYATLVGADGEEHAARASGRDPALEEVEDLPKGQSRRGWLTYEVPKNARKFQFRYSLPPAMNDAELQFDIEK
ncbi:MAG TPA: DUF4352 domain-containing protein [Thermoflexales bacterium]|nr:DUF4352 domain-containing protein [Thermoflexales bacterium]HQX11874.1 DUF4352 domain-containing protein [Thermoflexales bacterium]HQZ52538.1 DUF4352 domain-containing protein [Thermoflexales bacterium]